MDEDRSERRRYLPLFLVSGAVLLFEMVQIRVFALTLTPVLAYGAISLAMTGFGVGAMVVSLRPSIGRQDPDRTLGILAILQSAAMLGSCALLARTSWQILASFPEHVLPLVFVILIPQTLPFFFSGLFVAVLFGSARGSIGRLYFWNLFGSGVGCVALVFALTPLGGERVLAAASLLSAAGGVWLLWPLSSRVVAAVAAVVVAAGFASAAFPDAVFPFSPDPLDTMGNGIRVARARGTAEPRREHSEWNVVGKVEVWDQPGLRIRAPESLEFRVLSVDSGGTTQLIRDGGAEGWGRQLFEETIYGVAYSARPSPESVLVLGCGGGMDVQTALHHGAAHVTAVEINESTVRAVSGPYAEFLRWPTMTDRVTLLHDDGRAFVRGTSERFDVIQMTGVDTITVYATGSISMNEDSLYTVDAFEDYLGALRPDGVLAVLRVGKDYVRLTAIASEALMRIGVRDPAAHVVAFRQDSASGVLVKRTPFRDEEIARVERSMSRRIPNEVFVPHFDLYRFKANEPIVPIYLARAGLDRTFDRYFEMVRSHPEELPEFYRTAGIPVPTDDDPYYMLHLLLAARHHPGKFQETYALVRTFWWVVLALALTLIVAPVAVFRRRMPSWRPMAWLLPYFFGIGLCFMLIEIGVIHVCAIFVGSPGASLAVVLTGVLVGSGAGAYATEILRPSVLRKVLIAGALVVVSSLVLLFASDAIFDAVWSAGAGQPVRAIVACLLVGPLAFSLGWFFPVGLRLLRDEIGVPELIPWAVSINGFASVVGSVVVLPASMAWGFRAVVEAAVIGYALIVAVTWIHFRRRRSSG